MKKEYVYKRLMTILMIIILICCVLVSVQIVSAGSDIYVSTTGNDATGDGSIGTPYKSIWKAINESGTGDDIIVRGGTYNGTVFIKNHNGTSGDWLTIKPYTGETVILQSNAKEMYDDNATIKITCAEWVRITGFTIRNSRCYGITSRKDTVHHILIDNMTITNCSASGIYIYRDGSSGKPHNISVENCTVYNVNNKNAGYNANEGISFSGVTDFKINDNVFYGGGKECIDVKSGCNNGTILRNVVNTSSLRYNGTTYNTVGIYIDAYSLTDSDINVSGNFVYGNGTLIGVVAELATGKVDNVNIFNNILWHNGIARSYTNCLWIGTNDGTPGDCSHINFMYNTVVDSLDVNTWNTMVSIPQVKNDYTSIVVCNNVFVGYDNYYIFNIANMNSSDGKLILDNNLVLRSGGTTRVTWKDGTNPSDGTNRIVLDPMFTSVGDGNFYLLSSSPCLDVADETYVVGLDYYEVSRPQGSGYDLGAIEFVVASPPEPPSDPGPPPYIPPTESQYQTDSSEDVFDYSFFTVIVDLLAAPFMIIAIIFMVCYPIWRFWFR